MKKAADLSHGGAEINGPFFGIKFRIIRTRSIPPTKRDVYCTRRYLGNKMLSFFLIFHQWLFFCSSHSGMQWFYRHLPFPKYHLHHSDGAYLVCSATIMPHCCTLYLVPFLFRKMDNSNPSPPSNSDLLRTPFDSIISNISKASKQFHLQPLKLLEHIVAVILVRPQNPVRAAQQIELQQNDWISLLRLHRGNK